MQVETTEIPGVRILRPAQHADARGSFTELYNRRRAAEAGIVDDFVQDTLAVSRWRGTLRGLHFQRPPAVQAKLVQVLAGAVVDFVVDLRHGGPCFGRAISVRLDAEEGQQLYVPGGCAHGYCTLKDHTVVLYKVGDFYAPDCEMGLAADDPALRLPLPFPADELIASARDRRFPRLADLPVVFHWREAPA
jgi:dTDP-4-dehydrorhamnose 3,5-epimerase